MPKESFFFSGLVEPFLYQRRTANESTKTKRTTSAKTFSTLTRTNKTCALFSWTWKYTSFTKGWLPSDLRWLKQGRFFFCKNDKGEIIIFKPPNSFSIDVWKFFQRQQKKSIKKNAWAWRTHLWFWMILISLIEMIRLIKKNHKEITLFTLNYLWSLKINKQQSFQWLILHPPSKHNASMDETLQLQTFQETCSSVTKQSLIDSFYDPSFFMHTSKFNEFFLLPETPLYKGRILNS